MTACFRYIVRDVNAAIEFYTKQLGFKLEMHPASPFAEISRGDMHLYLTQPGGTGGGYPCHPAKTRLREAGIEPNAAAYRAPAQTSERPDAMGQARDNYSGTSEVTIYHNPNCGTSRNVLGLIRNAGIEPTIIEYLKAPPDRQTLLGLVKRMGIRVRELLRRNDSPYDELGLDDPKWTDDQLIDAMLANPILINRPIVVTPLGVKLCRPSETVLEILPPQQRGAFTKEDGEVVDD